MPVIGRISVGDGATFTPSVDNDGVISWSNNKNLENPASVDIPQAVIDRFLLAPIDSPAFTGVPTAPTPTTGDNSTKLATTEFVNGYLPLSGGTMTGGILLDNGSSIFKNSLDDDLALFGDNGPTPAPLISIRGRNRATDAGDFLLRASDGTNNASLIGKPDGTLTWNNNTILTTANGLPLSGGKMTGVIKKDGNALSPSTGDATYLSINGALNTNNGGSLTLFGKDHAGAGRFSLSANNGTDSKELRGTHDGTLTWDGKKVTVNSNIEDVTITANSTNVGNVGNYNNAYRCGCVVTIGFNFQIKAGVASGSTLFTGLPKPKKNIGVCLGSPSGTIRGYINTSGELKLDGAGPSSLEWTGGCITYITVD